MNHYEIVLAYGFAALIGYLVAKIETHARKIANSLNRVEGHLAAIETSQVRQSLKE